MITLVAFLHDVADHKYETPESLVEDYLESLWPELLENLSAQGMPLGFLTKELVMKTIRLISFSKEKQWRLMKLG